MESPLFLFEEYILRFPLNIQGQFRQLLEMIIHAFPDARALYDFNIPALQINSLTIKLGIYKTHISIFLDGNVLEKIRKETFGLQLTKNGIYFPLERPLPKEQIQDILSAIAGCIAQKGSRKEDYWKCEVCGGCFAGKNQVHGCVNLELRLFFTGWRQVWLPLYLELRELAMRRLAPFTEHYQSSVLRWRHEHSFAEFMPRKNALLALFRLATPQPEYLQKQIKSGGEPRYLHCVKLRTKAQLPALVEWIAESHDLAQHRLPKKEKVSPIAASVQIYEFFSEIITGPNADSAYVEFPFNVFVKGRVPVHATFDGIPHDGTLVQSGSNCHILKIQKVILEAIGKGAGDSVKVVLQERRTS